MEKHPLHLKIPELQTSDEVADAVEKQERLTGEDLPNDPKERLEAYMERLEKVFLNPDERVRERNLEMLRPAIYDAFLIKPEQVPEQAFLLEQKIAREQGWGTVEITDEFKQKKTEQIINDQRHSLDLWINYLASNDSDIPSWQKYLIFVSVVKMGGLKKSLDEEGKESAIFKKRNKETVASFPPLNARALALTISVLAERLEGRAGKRPIGSIENKSIKLNDEEFKKLLSSENFSNIYAQFLIELPQYSTEGLQEIRGKWIKYDRYSDHTKLVKSLEGYPLEWCTANPDTAKSHLEGGDFYVYYSINDEGKAVIPRLAIRMQEDQIAEDPRGIAPNQNLDPYITPVLDEKLKEFGTAGESYKKKSADMKQLTEIEKKTTANQPLTKTELFFLYEVNSTIEGFGYQKDPRVEEIRGQRNVKEDMSVIFDCRPDQIGTFVSGVNENTVAYIGEWTPTVFNKVKNYSNIKHIYERFPDKKVFLKTVETDPNINSAESAIKKLEEAGHAVSDYSKDLLIKANWQEKLADSYKIVSFSVSELFGDQDVHTYAEIKAKAQEQNLGLIPATLAPSIRLNYDKTGEWTVMFMEAIRGRDGNLRLFGCHWGGDESWLNNNYGHDGSKWLPLNRFFFVSK